MLRTCVSDSTYWLSTSSNYFNPRGCLLILTLYDAGKRIYSVFTGPIKFSSYQLYLCGNR